MVRGGRCYRENHGTDKPPSAPTWCRVAVEAERAGEADQSKGEALERTPPPCGDGRRFGGWAGYMSANLRSRTFESDIMKKLLVYRNGGGAIEVRIKTAVADYYRRRGRLPVGVVVNPTEVGAAREAVKALALRLPAAGNGGILLPEVWLQEVEEVIT